MKPILKQILKEMEDLRLRDFIFFDAAGKSILADYFITATADSVVQLEAVRNRLIETLKKKRLALKNPQEEYHGGWCLLDFGDYIVNVMLDETRSFYNLEGIFETAGYAKLELPQ